MGARPLKEAESWGRQASVPPLRLVSSDGGPAARSSRMEGRTADLGVVIPLPVAYAAGPENEADHRPMPPADLESVVQLGQSSQGLQAAPGRRSGAGVGHVRLTRRGRLVRTLGVVLALVVATAVAMSTGAGAAPSGVTAPTTVTVEPGQTLSGLAAVHLPHLPLDQAITEIQVINRISDSAIYVGQVLQLP